MQCTQAAQTASFGLQDRRVFAWPRRCEACCIVAATTRSELFATGGRAAVQKRLRAAIPEQHLGKVQLHREITAARHAVHEQCWRSRQPCQQLAVGLRVQHELNQEHRCVTLHLDGLCPALTALHIVTHRRCDVLYQHTLVTRLKPLLRQPTCDWTGYFMPLSDC